MPHYQTWEEFSRAAEKLYLADPMKTCTIWILRLWKGIPRRLLILPDFTKSSV